MAVSDVLKIATDILVILDFVMLFIIVFLSRNDPAATWAWLMVILLLPYFGIFIYLIIGLDGRKHRLFLRKMRADELVLQKYNEIISGLIIEQRADFDGNKFPHLPDSDHLRDMVYLNMFPGNAEFTVNNDVRIFHDGESKFRAMLHDISSAKRYIHMQYYIVHGDKLGSEIVTALARKAAEGLDVRLLVDGMGSYWTRKSFYDPLIKAGGKLGVFQPPAFVRINYRNHRKICVIDAKYAYIGGLNIGDEYVSRKKRFGFWRDTHLRVRGDSINSLELRFLMDWNFCSQDKIEMNNKYFYYAKTDSARCSVNRAGIQMVSAGPDTKWPVIQFAYNKMITEADKKVYIQSPYFVPDDSVFEALRIAALSGIDVRIMIPANPDHPFVYWAALSYLGELIEAGVKCYEYTNGFIHSKVVIVDGILASIGTANMDVRSFKLNLETNAFVFDKAVAEELERQFMIDVGFCREITKEYYAKRSAITKIRESFSRLLSPLL